MSETQEAVTEALRNWALMYPIPAWSLAEGGGAERLASNWARGAARMVFEALAAASVAGRLAVADDEVAALRAEITTGWWEVDDAGRDQALARLDRIAGELEKARAEVLGMTMRGDNVDAWLKRRRDWYERGESAYIALDDALNDYRDHAGTGTPLAEDVAGSLRRQG